MSLFARQISPARLRLGQVTAHLARANSPINTSWKTSPPAFSHSRTMASSIPSTMKGVIIEKTGGVEVLDYKTDLPVPQPKAGEILVHNDLVGVNYIDTYFRTGLYPSQKPEILGREGEGTVVAVGPGNEGTHFKQGQRIVWMSTGGYAEYTAVAAKNVWAVPDKLERGLAVASLLQGLTGITLVEEAHKVEKGDWVLVHAAAGGVGQWLVQLMRAKGAHTIATASTEEKRELARKLGADVAVGYGNDEVLDAVKKATNGAGVIAVFDGVGKDTFELSLEAVGRKGSLVSFGNASGPVPPLTIARLSAKNVKISRPTLFNYIATDEERALYGKELFALIADKKVDVSIHKTYPLSEVKDAHNDLEGRKTTGKLLLDPAK